MFSNSFPENHALYEIMGENVGKTSQVTDDNLIWRTSVLCCITDYRHTLMIFNTSFFPWQECIYESASMVRHTHLFFQNTPRIMACDVQ